MVRRLTRRQPLISILALVHEPPGRVATVIEPFADLNCEIVLAVDDRVPSSWLDGYRRIANRVLVVTFPGAFAYLFPWLVTQCRGRWILRLDDDEVPSALLATEVQEVVERGDITHAWIARRWLWPDGRSYLAQWPWMSDFSTRLLHNDPAVLRVPGRPHQVLAPAGQYRFLRAPLLHAHLILRSRVEREGRCEELERERPGLTIGGRPLNEAYYLPEYRAEPLLTDGLPAQDIARVGRFLESGETVGRRLRRLSPMSRFPAAEVTVLSKITKLPDSTYRARLRLAHRGSLRLPANELCMLDVEVCNDGIELWPGGDEADPAIRLGCRWMDEAGQPIDTGMRGFFGAPVAPGERVLVPVHVLTPSKPGSHRLDIDLVHESVRWFGVSITLDVEVVEAGSDRVLPRLPS